MASLYDVMGVAADADLDEVRRAYHRKAQIVHPDRYAASAPTDQQQAESEMKALNAAWSVQRFRRLLDALRHPTLRSRAP